MAKAIVHALTHRGGQRPHNEDALAVGDWLAANDLERPKRVELALDPPGVVVVADGMGGHAAGDVASRAATEYLQAEAGAAEDAAAAGRLLERANRRVYALMESGDGAPGMGTTAVFAVLRPDTALVGNVGDSRAYRLGEAGLEQISTDDTPGPKLADGRTAAMTTPILSQSLGGQAGYTEIVPHAEAVTLRPGERLLLCTDGLTDLVGAEEIACRLGADDDAAAVEALFRDAMARGGKDNVTIALIRLAE